MILVLVYVQVFATCRSGSLNQYKILILVLVLINCMHGSIHGLVASSHSSPNTFYLCTQLSKVAYWTILVVIHHHTLPSSPLPHCTYPLLHLFRHRAHCTTPWSPYYPAFAYVTSSIRFYIHVATLGPDVPARAAKLCTTFVTLPCQSDGPALAEKGDI